MQTIRKNLPINEDKFRRLEEYFSQPDPSDQRAKKKCSIQVEDLENSDVLEEWLEKRQAGTNLDPNKQQVPLQDSVQSDYLIELTRLREQNTQSMLSNLTVPDVDISSINSVASTPGQPRRSAALAPRRSSGYHCTPRELLQRKQIEYIEKANQNLSQQRKEPTERFNPTASSTPCRKTPRNNFLSKLSSGRPENNEVNVNQISSSDEPSPIQPIANKEASGNNKSESFKIAVEPVSTSQNDKTLVPCTQEQANAIQSNEDEEIIPESQDTEKETTITCPANNSLQGSKQQTNQHQTESNNMRTPPKIAKGVPPAWAQPILSTPKSGKNQASRLPFLRKTPQADTPDKRSSVAAQEIAQTSVLESTPTKSNRNNSFGQTLVVAVTNPSSLPATPTVAVPSIQLNVNINGSIPQSTHANRTAGNDGTVSKTVELDEQPSKNNGSNESIMTNDSDSLSDEVNKENREIPTPRLDHTENMPAKRQLVQSFSAIEVENSSVRQPIENRTHTINNESSFETSQKRNKRSTTASTFRVDSAQINGSNILPPINSETFNKQQSNAGNATYDISKHGVSTRTSMNTFTKEVHNFSRRRNTIDVPDDSPQPIADLVDLTIDSNNSSYETDDADAEVAKITGPPKMNASNSSSNHSADSIHRDDIRELSEESEDHSGTQIEGASIQIKEKTAEEIQIEIQNGNAPAAFNPVVALTQLPADNLGRSRTQKNGTQQRTSIRESESFSHMVPPIEFRDEATILDKSPESARREFSIEQTKSVNPPSISNSKQRKKTVNPELEAVTKTCEEIHRRRPSSSKRASKARKLFTHQNEDDDTVENVSTNTDTSTTTTATSTSTSTLKDHTQDDVFKKPLAPPKRSKLSLRLSNTSSESQSSNSAHTSQIDQEQSSPNLTLPEPTERVAEGVESTDQINVDEQMENQTDQVQQASMRPKRKTKAINRSRAKESSNHTQGNISLSNIIEDGDGARISRRTNRKPNLNSLKSQCMDRLKVYYDTSHKRKLSHAPSTTRSYKRPKLSENPSSRSKPSERHSSRSKPSERHSNRLKSNENHSSSTSEEERFKERLIVIQKNVIKQSWWKNLCDMSKKRKVTPDEADLNIRKVQGKRVESVNLNSIEFQQISDGFDIAIVPSEGLESRLHGYMRLKPSAIKQTALAENDTHFYIFNGEIVLNADSKKWELIGGNSFLIKAGIEYEIQNVGTDVCVLSFIYHKK